jgi:hypothetical protein
MLGTKIFEVTDRFKVVVVALTEMLFDELFAPTKLIVTVAGAVSVPRAWVTTVMVVEYWLLVPPIGACVVSRVFVTVTVVPPKCNRSAPLTTCSVPVVVNVTGLA